MSHPKDRYSQIDRREFLLKAAVAGVAVPSLAAILAACASDSSSAPAGGVPTLQLARPDNPVTLPLTDGNPAIADGLTAEAGPLKIFGYADYVWKKVRNQFTDRFGVDVEYTVFDTSDEMVSKLQSSGSDFDLLVTITVDNVGKLATGGLIQPLNHSYIPNVEENIWPEAWDFYDVGRQYTAPYTMYSTGIAWRNDLVSDDIGDMDNPWDILWDTRFKDQTHILNGSRDVMAAGLLRNGYDPNESDPAILETVKQDMLAGAEAMAWKFDHVDYTELAANQWQIHNAWSGQIAYYQYYLPKGLDIDAVSYIWPPRGPGGQKGLIGTDLFAIPKGAANPVLAHEFINMLWEPETALLNYTYEGFQPPLKTFDADLAVSDGYLPESLAYTIVTPEDIPLGVAELELEPAVNQLYQQIALEITGGA